MTTFTKRVNSQNDDGDKSSFGWFPTASTISTGEGSISGDLTTAVRFTNITINQGTTISSAKITFQASSTDTKNVLTKVYGIDEDDTATMSSDPTVRTKTTANTDWDLNGITTGNNYDATGLTAIVQEIINRGGWTQGNSIGFLIVNDGSGGGNIHSFDSYDGDSANAPLLTIEYSGSSPSASVSPSSSISPSSSSSLSSSLSSSRSPSPSPGVGNFFGLKIAKPGFNVLETQEPGELVFDSTKGTLKYFDKQTLQMTFNAGSGDITGKATYTHNLGYYPFVEVFVSVYIGSPTGVYEYCPFAGAGTTIIYGATYKITTTDITVYGDIGGASGSVWVFDFLIFIYKNDLKLN